MHQKKKVLHCGKMWFQIKCEYLLFFFRQNLFLYCADTMGWINNTRYNDPWYDGCFSGPILLEATQNEAFSSIYDKWRQKKWKNSDWKSSTAMDNNMFQELADKQEIIRYETWRDEKIDCSFVVPGTWYVSPSLISMDKTRQHWKTHMAAWRMNRRTQKMQNMHRTLAAHQSTSLL